MLLIYITTSVHGTEFRAAIQYCFVAGGSHTYCCVLICEGITGEIVLHTEYLVY